MIDFLTFRSFISPYALILFYYLGALVMPLAAWGAWLWMRRRWPLMGQLFDEGKRVTETSIPRRHRWLAIGLMIAGFLFMELLWRMLFEFLIAYLQMHEALRQLAA